ncbi:hypothetical protein H5410_020714 [Solanum commersonii]|uniref:Uncharacterized protein n=1 Tax=Solanum commersonii TaxID=4109 RepID=A0A9J5Z987_SOLCO|nr:hypothetical protein H5410_020714 [Solanum commersonii]
MLSSFSTSPLQLRIFRRKKGGRENMRSNPDTKKVVRKYNVGQTPNAKITEKGDNLYTKEPTQETRVITANSNKMSNKVKTWKHSKGLKICIVTLPAALQLNRLKGTSVLVKSNGKTAICNGINNLTKSLVSSSSIAETDSCKRARVSTAGYSSSIILYGFFIVVFPFHSPTLICSTRAEGSLETASLPPQGLLRQLMAELFQWGEIVYSTIRDSNLTTSLGVNMVHKPGMNGSSAVSKSVIITPESTYKGGWENTAHKIAMFIYEPTGEQEPQTDIVRQLGTSFKEAFNSNRWAK